jgi:predicted metalloprotease
MRWQNSRRSSNIEDNQSQSYSNVGSSRGSMMALLPIIKFLLGNKYGRIVLGIGVVAYFLGFNPLALLNVASPHQVSNQTSTHKNITINNEQTQFVSAVLAQTEDVWNQIFRKHNARYQEPKLVLFKDKVRSGCGFASSQTGPFYCPADQKVYLDTSFFDALASRHNSPGDFAQGYVIAHEVGHHIQKLTGILDKVQQQKQRISKKQQNALQVKVELQADCYAGIWANYLQKKGNILEDGDINEALRAASAIGDDTLQKQARGYVVPDSFTHGSSAQRKAWFKRGLKYGTIASCNTFAN